MTLSEEFLANGILKIPVEDRANLDHLRTFVCCDENHANNMHKNANIGMLNAYRMDIIKNLTTLPGAKPAYYSLAKSALHELVGNELVMQRNINLSIQIPGDDSSLLPIHADVLQGDSPYEVVLWIPLVDCYDTKSMFFCDKRVSDQQMHVLNSFDNTQQLYETVKPYCKFMDVKYGEALIFSQNILHGNVVNETNETRWSLNCRFKSLFSPYADKKLGEFFEPVDIRPATKLGLAYGC